MSELTCADLEENLVPPQSSCLEAVMILRGAGASSGSGPSDEVRSWMALLVEEPPLRFCSLCDAIDRCQVSGDC